MARLNCSASRQRGQAMTEFIIVVPVLILLIFGTVQIGFIWSAKTTLNYATFQAARLGALNHADYSGIRRGLVRGLSPLFTHRADVEAIKAAQGRAAIEVDNHVRVVRICPTLAQFSPGGFGRHDDDLGEWTIPNDNLMFRDPTKQVDGASIQDANLLKIRVLYCHRLEVPMVNRMIGALSALSHGGDYEAICGVRAGGRRGFILFADAMVRMQSAARIDSDSCDDAMVCR
jgi:hypothetical protein